MSHHFLSYCFVFFFFTSVSFENSKGDWLCKASFRLHRMTFKAEFNHRETKDLDHGLPAHNYYCWVDIYRKGEELKKHLDSQTDFFLLSSFVNLPCFIFSQMSYDIYYLYKSIWNYNEEAYKGQILLHWYMFLKDLYLV